MKRLRKLISKCIRRHYGCHIQLSSVSRMRLRSISWLRLRTKPNKLIFLGHMSLRTSLSLSEANGPNFHVLRKSDLVTWAKHSTKRLQLVALIVFISLIVRFSEDQVQKLQKRSISLFYCLTWGLNLPATIPENVHWLVGQLKNVNDTLTSWK